LKIDGGEMCGELDDVKRKKRTPKFQVCISGDDKLFVEIHTHVPFDENL
jgi:hypothetical protein